MKTKQIHAIRSLNKKVHDALEPRIGLFLDHLSRCRVINRNERKIVENEETPTSQLLCLLELIYPKRKAWSVFICYLRNNEIQPLAKKLQRLSIKTVRSSRTTASQKRTIIERFLNRLVDFYKTEYCNVMTTTIGFHNSVEKVWVPLRFEEKTTSPGQQDSFDHVELLKRLADTDTSKVALVEGHPYVGKTTSLKKIALDWANKLRSDQTFQFRAVLVIPLKDVRETDNFLQMAADYYGDKFELSVKEKAELLKWLNGLDSQLLICLDGLDEYSSLTGSPFKAVFSPPFEKPPPPSKSSPPSLPYLLLITSRPYACRIIHPNFFALRFEICPLEVKSSLEDSQLVQEFVNLHVFKPGRKENVTNYIRDNLDTAVNLPLFLELICDSTVEGKILIDSKSLYEKFLSYMVKRAMDGEKLDEKFDLDKWKASNLVTSLAHLAFEGSKNKQFSFIQENLDIAGVTNDSFKCGFLFQHFDYGHEIFYARFPHPSVQQYFAALYYHQVCIADKIKGSALRKEIPLFDGRFKRFCIEFGSIEVKLPRRLNLSLPDATGSCNLGFR